MESFELLFHKGVAKYFTCSNQCRVRYTVLYNEKPSTILPLVAALVTSNNNGRLGDFGPPKPIK
jgi:hypothetical protein